MVFALKHIRKIIFTLSSVFASLCFLYNRDFSTDSLQAIALVQTFAFTALFFLYLALLISPLYQSFPGIPFKAVAVKARRALGVSAFFFAFLHGSIVVFSYFGGLDGLLHLPDAYRNAIVAGSVSLGILSILAVTSFDWAVKKMGKYWKRIHRLVYLAGYLVLYHATTVGSHFSASTIHGSLVYVLVTVLLALESVRVTKALVKRYPALESYVYVTLPAVFILLISPVIIFAR